ncbi:MAG: VanZ family protein [Saprospiraceae bacterium]|nr:VanZ family protein [Saprospiraceae bacterium]
MPGSSIPKVGWQLVLPIDKIAHFGLYFVLAVLLAKGLGDIFRETKFKIWALIIIICAVYGVALESIQYYFLSDRSFEIPDIIANISGSIAGTVFVYLFLKK